MRTRLTDLLGIAHPIVLPGMTYIAVPSLVAAVSNAGGLGILAAGALTPEGCREAIREVRRLTDKPFGVGCSLGLPGAAECARVAIEERVPMVNVSMGKGEWVIEAVRAYGGKVIATISSEAHARSALSAGADGLIVTGHEAAAHGGAVTSMVLIPAVRDLMNLVRFCLATTDDYSLCCVLKSPIFRLNEDDIFKICKNCKEKHIVIA